MRAILAVLLIALAGSCMTYGAPEWPHPYENEIWHFNGKPIIFKQGPLRVWTTETTAMVAHEAVYQWNAWLGFELLVFTPIPEKAQILVGPGSVGPNQIAITQAVPGRRLIVLTNRSIVVVVHEFGHALGLAHDPDNKRSVMFPNPVQDNLPWVEPQDVAALKLHYRKYVR